MSVVRGLAECVPGPGCPCPDDAGNSRHLFDERRREGPGGTAFLVSASGDIVTAYHVVQGATAISLQEPSRGAIETTGILVRAVDAQRDLAVLTDPSVGESKGLGVEGTLSESDRGSEGHRLSKRDAQRCADFCAHTERPTGYGSPSPFRDSQGRPLLNGNVEVIPLDMTIYGGVSGAPLIDASESVVGVVSGSLNEGGSFAWAIPIAQVTALLEKGATGRPFANYAWPEEALMAPMGEGVHEKLCDDDQGFLRPARGISQSPGPV